MDEATAPHANDEQSERPVWRGIWWGLAALFGLGIATSIAFALVGTDASVAINTVEGTTLAELETLEEYGHGHVAVVGSELRFVRDQAGPALRLAAAAPTLVVLLLATLGAVLAERATRDITTGSPFSRRTVSALTNLSWLLAVAAILPGAAAGLAQAAMLSDGQTVNLMGSNGPFSVTVLQLEVMPLLAAAFVGLIARAFRHGANLADDVEGLV